MCSSDRHPIFCIVPPYMLENIAENGSAPQREMAQKNLAVATDVRSKRVALSNMIGVRFSAIADEKNRQVFNAHEQGELPGRLVRSENDPPTGDPAVDEAYDGAGLTYDLYKDVYGRNSIDNRGLPIKSTVHFQKGYDNAFWNGQQMVYGDGDEDMAPENRLFNRFTIALDIIGHELAHGVTHFEARLVYQDQPGALNESMSDVFGSLVKQRARGHSAREADWLIGEGLLTAKVNGRALRSLKEPGTAYNDPVLGKDPQPSHMDGYIHTQNDNGGVHLNSSIPNHAFYVAAYEMDGFAWEKAGRIWYATLCDKLNEHSNFQDAANLTFSVAGMLYGEGSLEQQAVRTGWNEVGIQIAAVELPPTPDPDPTAPPPLPNPNPAPVPPPGGSRSGCRPSVKSLLGVLW